MISYTYGWRILSEVLTLERRQLDLTVGTLRLAAGDTKNDDGRVVYLTPELAVVLREQLARVEALQRQNEKVTPWLFPHLHGRARLGKRRQDIEGAWKAACKPAYRGASLTTSAGPRCATSNAPACRGPSQ